MCVSYGLCQHVLLLRLCHLPVFFPPQLRDKIMSDKLFYSNNQVLISLILFLLDGDLLGDNCYLFCSEDFVDCIDDTCQCIDPFFDLDGYCGKATSSQPFNLSNIVMSLRGLFPREDLLSLCHN